VTPKPDPRGIEPARELAAKLGMTFERPYPLLVALTHRSYVNENPYTGEDNERMEFLGDAVLDFIVGAWVYRRFITMAEGELTKLRSALVCNEQLAEFARRYDVGTAMRMGRGESSSGGRNRDAILGSAFEAIIGAYYLEAGIEAVEKWITPLLESVEHEVLFQVQDPKSHFQEQMQAIGFGTPYYRVVGSSGPDHARLFDIEVVIGETVYGHGSGSSKQAAERAAAEDALGKKLIAIPGFKPGALGK
jgi:ribonuclease-3